MNRTCKLLIFTFVASAFLSLPRFANATSLKTWVVEFYHLPSSGTLRDLQNQGFRVSKLSPYRSQYFDRVYRVSGNLSTDLALKANAAIKAVEEVSELEEFSVDPLLHEQWALQNIGQSVREEITDLKSTFRKGVPGADLSWGRAQPGLDRKMRRDAVVAVLDSGVDYEHEDLKESIAVNTRECEKGEIPLGEAKEDKDGNGYKGDCKGINLTALRPPQKNRPLDSFGHGTHVASLIAAAPANGVGIAGISSRIKILPVKITSENDRKIRVALSDRVAEGILYAVSRQVDVINMSVGWPRGLSAKHVEEAINEATRRGIIVVAAAGNNSHSVPIFPCAYENVICVGASRNDGAAAKFTNFGAHVDLLAPGDNVLGAYPTTMVPNYPVPGYEVKSGTSQSAPYVAGVFAIAKAIDPTAASKVLIGKVLQSTRALSASETYFNNGVVDLEKLGSGSANFLRWQYKNTVVLALDARGGFTLPIKIQNLSAAAKTAVIEVQTQTSGVALRATKRVSVGAWQDGRASFSGQVQNPNIESQLQFTVKINGVERKGEALLAKHLDTIRTIQTLRVQDSSSEAQLFTMPSLDNEVKGLHYFNLGRLENNTGLLLKVWRRDSQRLTKVGQVTLPEIVTPVGAFELDANLDGRRDIAVLGLRKVEVEKDGEKQEEYRLSIFYFDAELRPLIPAQARVDLQGENIFNYSVFGNHRKTRWVPQYFPGFGYLKTPSVIESGLSPKEDLSDNDRRAQRNPMIQHLYYLQPVGQRAGQYALSARIVDSAAMQAQVRQQLDLRHYDVVAPQWTPVTQTEERDARYIFRAGVLEASKVLALNLTPQGPQWQALNWRSPYMNYEPLLAINLLSPMQPRDVLFGMVAPNRGHIVVLDARGKNVEQSVAVDLPDEWEDIIRPLYVTTKGSELTVVLESGLSMYGFTYANGRLQSVHQRRIVRSTFNGNIASQVFLPIRTGQGKAALYVDSTQIFANNVFLWQLDSAKGFFAPLATSYTLPENCRALNPVQWQHSEAHKLSFQCKTDRGLELRYLPQ